MGAVGEIAVNPVTERREMTAAEIRERVVLNVENTATAIRRRVLAATAEGNGHGPHPNGRAAG